MSENDLIKEIQDLKKKIDELERTIRTMPQPYYPVYPIYPQPYNPYPWYTPWCNPIVYCGNSGSVDNLTSFNGDKNELR